MAELTIAGADLHVRLSRAEKFGGLLGDLRVPLDAITAIRRPAAAFDVIRGLRSPGFQLPWRTRIGTWRRPGARTFAVANRTQPALHLRLAGRGVTDVVVTLPDADAWAEKLRAELAARGLDAVVERDVVLDGAGIPLATTIAEGVAAPRAVAILLPGSGPVDRDSDHPSIPLGVSRDLAHALAPLGVRTVRYDKRGVGASGGDRWTAGLSDQTADATAVLDAVVAEGLPTFVIGHSEGGMLAEAVAAGRDDLAGVVLLAAPAATGEETMAWQTRQIADVLPPFARTVVKLLRVDLVAQQAKSVAAVKATTTDVARIKGAKINAKWQRELLAFDPAPYLARIAAPTLAITGRKDLQVNADDLARIAELIPAPVETHDPADLTHLLRSEAGAPSLAGYKKLARRPVDAQLVTTVTDWIAARLAPVVR